MANSRRNTYVSSATDLLSQQLIDIESAFNNLSFAFKEDLENLRENLSKFSVTLFGRTMAGKSTLMEILTNGDGLSIGNGAQRTYCRKKEFKISIEEKIGVAHIPMDGLPPYILTRIRLAQQFARIVITDQ